MRWESSSNGKLLRAAADNGFDAFLSIDKKIEYEQNLRKLPLPVIVLNSFSNALPNLLPFVPATLALLSSPLIPVLYFIERDGTVVIVESPR